MDKTRNDQRKRSRRRHDRLGSSQYAFIPRLIPSLLTRSSPDKSHHLPNQPDIRPLQHLRLLQAFDVGGLERANPRRHGFPAHQATTRLPRSAHAHRLGPKQDRLHDLDDAPTALPVRRCRSLLRPEEQHLPTRGPPLAYDPLLRLHAPGDHVLGGFGSRGAGDDVPGSQWRQ
jgi:hypothetical protein